ncbi:MAG: sulfite exporter TauE/SafE family protein [Phycisphaerales bacterium]|nr:sulfite exporter TauE/SafE family protein [Planctomycetota bacterium]MCH8508936.1 sulfite exporter TauE/SafE family protein [Phycisphaerales bacterium]
MIFALLGALAIGLSLGLFGSGGSILTVPVLVYLLGHPDKVAIAESLAIVGGIAFLGALPYARAKLIDWRSVGLFGVPAMIGTYGGAWIAGFVPGYVQLLVFACVMLLAAQRMWKPPKPAGNTGDAGSPDAEKIPARPWARIVGDGVVVGVLTGFVGVGGGFLIVPALVLLGGLPMRRAVATSLVIIALKSAAGFWKYLGVLSAAGDGVDWTIIGLFVLIGFVGSLVGKALNTRVKQESLRRGFALFLVVMAVFILIKEISALIA